MEAAIMAEKGKLEIYMPQQFFPYRSVQDNNIFNYGTCVC